VYKILLIDMPFALLHTSSIALTQLKSVLDSRFDGKVCVEIHYLNQDFAQYMGVALYQYIALSVESLVSGVGEWFFRQSAFPELADNTQEYFSRYYPHPGKRTQVLKYAIQKKREGVDDYLGELIAKYDLDQAAVVGFTSMFSQNPACFAMARNLKERNPDIITVMGGPNCQSPMGEEIVRHVPQIDYVFSGPALESFPEFIQCCLDRNLEARDRIDGVFSKANVAMFSTQATSDECVEIFGRDLDINTKVELDYEPFLESFERHFRDKGMKPLLLFETSRGCWWGQRSQCKFCGLNSARMDHRVMSPERAIEQFKSLFEYASPLYLSCIDNIMPKSFINEVFAYLDTPPDVTIFYKVRVPLSEENVQTLSKAGVKIIQPGIEALATSALKAMGKGTTAFQNLLCLKNCLRYGVYPMWNFMVGLPGGEEEEVYEKYLRDIPLLVHLPPPTGVQTVGFERYSPYFVNAQQYGLDLQPSDFYSFVYPFDEEVLKNLAYNFTNQNFSAPYLATMVKWIGRVQEKCNLWWARWHGKDQVLPPRLFFKRKEDLSVVYDSRSGEVVEYQIDHTATEVLKHLNKPRKLAQLAEDLSDVQNFDPAKEIASLQDRGLVFEENGRFISLVLPEEPPPVNAQALEYFSSFTHFMASFSD
jgi:ribosomal peptide maturation radical SAM protein 1